MKSQEFRLSDALIQKFALHGVAWKMELERRFNLERMSISE